MVIFLISNCSEKKKNDNSDGNKAIAIVIDNYFFLNSGLDWFLYDNDLRHERVKMR